MKVLFLVVPDKCEVTLSCASTEDFHPLKMDHEIMMNQR